MLEDNVDKKYYLSEKVQERFKITDHTFTKNIIGTTKPEFRTIGQRDLVYQEDSIMGALVATDYKQPKQVAIRLGGLFDDEKGKHQAGSIWNVDGLAPTLDTMQGGYRQPCIIDESQFAVRKTTPKECWRLMGFEDSDIDKCIAIGISDTQLYKQAGNSICVNVLVEIFKELFKAINLK